MTKRNERAAAPSRETAAHYPETIDHERTSNGADEVDSIALSTPRDFALWFARNGFRVFPLPPGEKESKVRWDRVATTDPEKIASWFDEDGGGANYGVPAALNGLVILDEDRPGALAEAGVEIGPTFTVRTSKGFHRYLQSDEDFSQSSPWDDVDVRARGYVVGPGSVNSKTGAVYELVDDRAPADLPAPVADALRTATALRDFSPIVDEIERPAVALSPAQTAYVERAVAGVLADLEALGDLGDGQRDDRGRGWDSGTYGLAARLVELSNAAGDVYPIERAREDFLARAPRDRKFTDSHVASKFDDALDDVGDRPAELPADEDPADDFGDLGGASAPARSRIGSRRSTSSSSSTVSPSPRTGSSGRSSSAAGPSPSPAPPRPARASSCWRRSSARSPAAPSSDTRPRTRSGWSTSTPRTHRTTSANGSTRWGRRIGTSPGSTTSPCLRRSPST